MDDWDFMEFSEITALLTVEKDEVGLTQLFRDSDSLPEIVASQSKSESCSSLTTESRTLSPTSDQESTGASENSSQAADGDFLKLNENHGELIESMSVMHPCRSSSGNSTNETSFWPQDPVVRNRTSTSTASEAPMCQSFVRVADVKQWGPNSVSTPPAKLNGEAIVRLLEFEGSFMEKPKATSHPQVTDLEDDGALSDFHISDLTRLVQSSKLPGTSSEGNVARRHRGLSDVSQQIKQRHILRPTSFVASTSGHDAKLQDGSQSVMQNSTPIFPSCKGQDQVHFHKHSVHASNETIEQASVSDEKQVVEESHAHYHPTQTGLGHQVGGWQLGDMISKQASKLTAMVDSSARKTTKAEHQMLPSAVKCRSRSKPGFSTNPRSLTEMTRRKRINERLKELQGLVPKSIKGDNIVDMLDQAITYVGNLEEQLQVLLVQRSNQSGIDFNLQARVSDDETQTTNSQTAKRVKYC